MIDPLTEKVKPLSALARILSEQTGQSLAPSTLWRWTRKGLVGRDGKRVYLEVVRVGGTTCSNEDAARRFFNALSGASDKPALALVNVPALTEKRLDAAGI